MNETSLTTKVENVRLMNRGHQLISDGTHDQPFMEQESGYVRRANARKLSEDFVSVQNVEKAEATGRLEEGGLD